MIQCDLSIELVHNQVHLFAMFEIQQVQVWIFFSFRFQKMLEPLQIRRSKLEKVKTVHQFQRDLDDEKIWIHERMPQATSTNYGSTMLGVQVCNWF